MAKNRIICKVSLFFMALFITSQLSLAQTDVTSDYLENAGFDLNCNYLSGVAGDVATTESGNSKSVVGWDVAVAPAWSAGGTFEYGWSGSFNGAAVPSTSLSGAAGAGQGVLGLTVGWSGIVAYSQAISLPAGKYSMVFSMRFMGETTIKTNQSGWLPDAGDAMLSDIVSIPEGQWKNDTLTFVIYETTSGKVQVGMQAAQSTSASNARVFCDGVKIIHHEIKPELQGLVDEAHQMYETHAEIGEDTTAYTVLLSAIDQSQALLDDDNAEFVNLSQAVEDMETAIEGLRMAIFYYGFKDASLDNPMDLTLMIENPDFEDDGGSTKAWTTTLGIHSAANTRFNGAPNPNHVLDGDPQSSTVAYQTISGLPVGVYTVKAVARGRAESSAKMYISAEAGSVFGTSLRQHVVVDRVGDSGGDLNYGFSQYETPYVLVSQDDNAMTIGVYFAGNCGWSSVDNFELNYLGRAEPVVGPSSKLNLQHLKIQLICLNLMIYVL